LANTKIGRSGLLDDPARWLMAEEPPVGVAISQIRVKSVCFNVNPEAMTALELSYPFGLLPTTCPQCRGNVIADTMMLKVLCYWEKIVE